MSYDPRLIISYRDLHEASDKIRTFAYHPDGSDAVKYLEKLLNDDPIKIKNIEIVTCHPELTSFNKKVRELLHEFDIEFAVDY